MKRGAGADAAIVEDREDQSDREAEDEAGKKNGLAREVSLWRLLYHKLGRLSPDPECG